MATRKIVKIDEEKCNGCGLCIPNCAEGALKIVDGKAKLVKEIYCDGLGACLGHCPEGAITIIEREAESFDEEATKRHLEEIKKSEKKINHFSCPGQAMRSLKPDTSKAVPSKGQASQLLNWPIQMMLIPVEAPYFKDADLLIAADCVSFSYPDFHGDFLKGKVLLIGCPKLDAATIYEEKLEEIFRINNIKSITVLHMEVPCCFGLKQVVREALKASGKDIPLKEINISIDGNIKD